MFIRRIVAVLAGVGRCWPVLACVGLLVGEASLAVADEPYIPLISKGFQHQFWQAVKAGAEPLAKAHGVRITRGPGNRDEGR
jgi:ABC-type sugar transport system substrate-binding protein